NHWEKIFHLKPPKLYAKGDVIISQGEDNQNIFYIDRGLVEYTYTDKTGAENLIEVLGEGNMLNLQPVFGKNPSIATFFALTDSKLYALSATEVREHMMKDKFLVEELLEEMAIVIGGLNRQTCISAEKSNSRLLQILFMLAENKLRKNPDIDHVRIRLSQDDLARITRLTRVTVSKILSDLRHKSIIETDYGEIVIMDMETLRELSTSAEY
ncbi:MAG: Crp/Fnr family transcriptional regulator, partial [Clostridiales Family XIII bacterium]|nr:Crp/Fnr family transcriptional regulator [Clostridiales Family XIII bacterium]